MTRWWLIAGGVVLAAVIATLVGLGWLLGHELPALLNDVWVNGQRVDLSGLNDGQWLGLGIGAVLALSLLATLLTLVLPLVLTLAVGLPLLLGGVALAAALAVLFGALGLVLALLLAPLWLLGGWLWKRAAPRARIPG